VPVGTVLLVELLLDVFGHQVLHLQRVHRVLRLRRSHGYFLHGLGDHVRVVRHVDYVLLLYHLRHSCNLLLYPHSNLICC
jgi:hypothetical protein